MNQKLIKQIENQIEKTKALIQAQKQELTIHENTFLALIEELVQIKQQIKKKITKKPWK